MALIVKQNNDIEIGKEAEYLLEYYDKQIKKLEIERSQLFQKLQKEMEKNNVKKIETEKLSLTYVPETDVEYFDKKTLKEEDREIYNRYCKIRKKGAFVRLTIHDRNNDKESQDNI